MNCPRQLLLASGSPAQRDPNLFVIHKVPECCRRRRLPILLHLLPRLVHAHEKAAWHQLQADRYGLLNVHSQIAIPASPITQDIIKPSMNAILDLPSPVLLQPKTIVMPISSLTRRQRSPPRETPRIAAMSASVDSSCRRSASSALRHTSCTMLQARSIFVMP